MSYCMSNYPPRVQNREEKLTCLEALKDTVMAESPQFCPGSPLICDNDRCANVMRDLFVSLRGWAWAGALAVTAIRCRLFTMVTVAVCYMAQCGKRGGFNRTVFAEDFMKVQRLIWSLGWKSHPNPHICQHSPVLLSRPGLQLSGISTLLVAVSMLWISCSWVAVWRFQHTKPFLFQRHLQRERLDHAVQWATLLTFTQYQATEQRAGHGPVTSRSLSTSCVMSDILA